MRLPEPRTAAGAAGLAAVLAQPDRALIAVDFDGTLAPIVPVPADARPAPGALAALARAAAAVDTVALITGRPIEDIHALGGVVGAPGLGRLVVLGQYGVERWDAATGVHARPRPAPGVEQVRRRLPQVLAQAGIPSEQAADAVEDKGHAIVVHTRRLPDPAGTLDRLRSPLASLGGAAGLEVVPGRMVIELRPPGVDKGAALRMLAAERSAAAVIFVGDDLGDVPAFAAVEDLRAEGVSGLTVCSDSPEVAAEVRDRADLVVDGPPGVVAFVDDLATAIGSPPAG